MKKITCAIATVLVLSGCASTPDELLNTAAALAPVATAAALSTASQSGTEYSSYSNRHALPESGGYSQRGAFDDCAALYSGLDQQLMAECQRQAANMSSLN